VRKNQHISAEQIAKIRSLDDFDLVMLISEIHGYGWKVAARTLSMMPANDKKVASHERNDATGPVRRDV
jgi:hypothetical protein